jgi:hypothetical protein
VQRGLLQRLVGGCVHQAGLGDRPEAVDEVRERAGGEEVVPVVGRGVGRAHEHDPVVLRVLDPEPHVGAAAGSHRLDRVVDAGAGRLDGVVEPFELPGAHLEEQVLLVAEVAVDRRRGDAGGVGDGADGYGVLRSRLQQQPFGDLEDLGAEVLPFALAGTRPRDRHELHCTTDRGCSAVVGVGVADPCGHERLRAAGAPRVPR